MKIAGLVFGILSCVFALLGLPLGITGLLLSVDANKQEKTNIGTAGIFLSIIGIALSVLIFFLLYLVYALEIGVKY